MLWKKEKKKKKKRANLLYIPLGNSGVVIPDFHLFGGHDELLFFGDDEDENSLAR